MNDITPADPEAGYVQAEQITLARFKPGEVTADANIRKDAAATVDAAFVAKIKATGGNRVPAVVMRSPGGGHRLRYGFRRHVACERAGVLLYAMIAGDEGDSQAERRARVLDQLAENDGRVPLTRAEECAALLTLFDGENMTAAGIAKATGRGKPQVVAALAVARSELASKAADKWEFLTLEQAAALTEFEDDPDPEALKRLVATAKNDPDRFGHVAAELRATRADRAAKAALTGPLTAEGYAIVETRPPNWKLLENLTHGGLPLTAGGFPEGTASHAACPGRGVWIVQDWQLTPEAQAAADAAGDDEGDPPDPRMMNDEELAAAGYEMTWHVREYLCTDPDGHGHEWVRRGEQPSAAQTAEALAAKEEEERQKNRRVRARNKLWYAATDERARHLAAFAGRKEITPKAAADEAAWLVLDNLIGGDESADLRYAIERGHETAAELLGINTRETGASARKMIREMARAATPKRRLVIQTVVVLAAYEKFCRDPHTWQNAEAAWVRRGRDLEAYRTSGEAAPAYLAWLEAHTGYRLSEIEEEVVRPPAAGPPADVAPGRAGVDTGQGLGESREDEAVRLAAEWAGRLGGVAVVVFTAAEAIVAGQRLCPVSDTEIRRAADGEVFGAALHDAATGQLVAVGLTPEEADAEMVAGLIAADEETEEDSGVSPDEAEFATDADAAEDEAARAEAAYVAEHGDDDLETGHTRDPAGDEAAHA